MKQQKLAYIASPYAPVIAHYGKAHGVGHVMALSIAQDAAKKARELGYIPVSPVLTYNNVYNENLAPGDRAAVLEAGLRLLERCDLLLLANCKFADKSEGMKTEEAHAYKLGMRVEVLDYEN